MTNELGHACAATRAVARTLDDKHMGITLGAYRRAKGMSWVPGAFVDAWLACARQEVATGAPWPHAYFITTIGHGGADSGSIHCPSCRAELAAIRAGHTAPAAATAAPKITKPIAFQPSADNPF